jgi:hypothetical protein
VPTRLLVEGSDITELLARVRRDHGGGARIVKAEKLRVGGLAGFFAKVRYEVVVEVADLVPDTASAAASVTPGTVLPEPGTSLPVASSIEELAALADSADRAEVAGTVQLAHSAQTDTGLPADVVLPDTEVPAEPEPERELVASRAPGRPLSTESDAFAAVLSRLTDGLGGGIDFDSLPPAPVEPPAEFRPLYGTAMPPAVPPAVSPAVLPARTEPTVAVGPLGALRTLGVPGHLAVSVGAENVHADLVRAFTTLPSAPALPKRPGDVLVVVGEAASALEVGRRLAIKMHLDPAKVLLAAASTAGTGVHAARRITGAADAERRARRMHRADVAHVVVVDASLDGDGAEWAREIADSVGATQVWAVVDATRKVGDLADHLDRLGGVDALVVQRSEITRDPASVLDLGVPVAVLDTRPATPRAWADLISIRLDATSARTRAADRRGHQS